MSFFGYTFPFEGNWNVGNTLCFVIYLSANLWIHFPVWRELKQKLIKISKSTCDCVNFGYTFPFEGNWNNGCILESSPGNTPFGYTFPFEGNWNSASILSALSSLSSFGYTFPFEGNWNIVRKTILPILWKATLDTLSRLKGIETHTPGSQR